MPPLRVVDADGLELRHHACPLSPSLAEAFRAVAGQAAKRHDPRLVDERLRRYEWAVAAYRSGRLRAFLLGQTRSIDGAFFVYFGPLYSTHGAFLPLFAHALRSVCSVRAPWWLVAEIEHPRLRPLFAHLVPSSWPRPGTATPPEIVRGAQALAGALGHVRGLDPETLRTSCPGGSAQLVVAQASTPAAASAVARDPRSGTRAVPPPSPPLEERIVSRAPGLLFALVREDPAVERSLVARWGARRIVVVGSGGCTALSLLSDAVDEVCVVDGSAAQMALVALRAAAVRSLDRDGYMRFVGALDAGDGARLAAWNRVRPELPADARAYWDACPDAIDAGVDASGVTESFYQYVGRSLTRSDWPADVWRSLLEAPSMDAQRAIFARHFADDRFRVALEMLLSRGTHELFYPPSIFAHVAEHDFARFFARRFREYGEKQLFRANYFLSQIVFGRYEDGVPEGVPPYLTEAGYADARRNLHKLRLVTGRLEHALDGAPASDAFFLSNVLDWASPEQAARVGTAVARASRPGAVVLLRHMLGRPGFPPSFDVRFDAGASRDAQETERSFLYGAISIGLAASSR